MAPPADLSSSPVVNGDGSIRFKPFPFGRMESVP